MNKLSFRATVNTPKKLHFTPYSTGELKEILHNNIQKVWLS